MRIKRIASAVLGFLCLTVTVNAKDLRIDYDRDAEAVKISCSDNPDFINTPVALFMHLPTDDFHDIDLDSLKQLSPYFYEKTADNEGNVNFDFVFTGVSGNYTIRLASENGNLNYLYELFSSEDLKNTLDGLNLAIKNNDVAKFIGVEANRQILGIDGLYSQAVSKTAVADALTTAGELDTYKQVYAALESISGETTLLKSLNSMTVWAQVNPLVKEYFENIKTSSSVYAKYNGLTSRVEIDKKILASKPFSDLDSFENTFNAIVNTYINEHSKQQTGGGSGGGGGGGSTGAKTYSGAISSNSSGSVTVPVYTNDPITDNSGKLESSIRFFDVPDGYWAKSYIESLAAAGIVDGTGDGNFDPQQPVLREQFIKMLLIAADIKSEAFDCTYTDVDKDEWYYSYVATASIRGLATGYSDSVFGIGNKITRQDMCVLAYRLIASKTDIDDDIAVLDFNDADMISSYAADAIGYMKNKGIISGYDDNSFIPDGYTTRAEASKIIFEVRKLLSK